MTLWVVFISLWHKV